MQRLDERKAVYPYPVRSAGDSSSSQKSAEAIVGGNEPLRGWKSHIQPKGRMLEWAKKLGSLWPSNYNRNPSANYLHEDKPEAESIMQEELSEAIRLIRTTPGVKTFF